MRKARKSSNDKRAVGLTVQNVPTAAQAESSFAGSIEKKDNGSNSYVAEFLQIMRDVTASSGAISFSQVATANRVTFQIPFTELDSLWTRYTQKMVQICKWERIEGCYDEPVFVCIG